MWERVERAYGYDEIYYSDDNGKSTTKKKASKIVVHQFNINGTPIQSLHLTA